MVRSPRSLSFAVVVSVALGVMGVPNAPRGDARTVVLSPATATTSANASAVRVVASGLTNPRGFAFGQDATLAVALAGKGGASAGVVAIEDGCPVVLADGVPSYRVVFGGPTGVADVAFLNGETYALVSGGNIDRGGMDNGLYRLDGKGGLSLVADISAFIRDHPVAERPRDYDTDGQPYALLEMDDGFWVTEGNSDQVLRVGLDGSVSRVADLSRGHPIPTGIAPAPDDGAYVAYFTHIPYGEGAAKVIHVGKDGRVTDFWTGLTLITALATGPDGELYALEMATGIDPDDPASIRPGSGKVVRKTGAKAAADVVTGLSLPAAMDFGPDGALYVASPTFGADDGQGTIVRIDLQGELPISMPMAQPTEPGCP